MTSFKTRRLGRTALELPVFGIGTCPLGELFEEIEEETASATFATAWNGGVRYYDTAPWYGLGQGEHRTGRFLYRRPRQGYVLATKVGRRLFAPRNRAAFTGGPWKGGLSFDWVHDYTYDGILRSYEDSLQRLGINKVDILYIHDLDRGYFPDETDLGHQLRALEEGGFRALEELKAAGEIGAIGAGINERGMINRFLDRFPLDVFLVASRYTLLEQDIWADELIRCQKAGAGLVIGGVFNSGILATGPVPQARFEYAAAPPEILSRVARLAAVTESHGVPLAAAALQFPLGLDIVASVICGPVGPEEIAANITHFHRPIPDGLWSDLKSEGLIASDVPTPTAAVRFAAE
jgi:D-threo-aldose 1-dehydrogenase